VRGALRCEGVFLERIAARAGTPAYVYSRASIENAYRLLDGFFRGRAGMPHTICYAVKANGNLSILRLLARLGSGFDVVSGGELERLLRIGADPRRVVFSGVGKLREEIRLALRSGIRLFNVESEGELDVLAGEAARLRVRVPAGVRVSPDVGAGAHPHISTGLHRHKFGVEWPDALRLYRRFRGSRWISWAGISMHIGSQILSVEPFGTAAARLAGWVRRLRSEGIALDYVDCGGGMGIRYASETPLDARRYARRLIRVLKPLGCHLLLEPGRWLVGRGRRFVVVDAGMNDFLRPALYGALHPIAPAQTNEAARGGHGDASARADVVGPVCETGDCFVADYPLGNVEPGDLLVIWGTGAYGFVSASNYNARPRPAEVLVEGSRFRVIRRRESVADLMRGEL
jgi:diaminopimelate decarboxylase